MDKRVFVFDETNIVNRNSYHSLDLQSYTHLRGYHACRPILIESYLEKGIVPINENDALKHALYLLQDEGISEKKIIQVFTSHWSSLIESQKCVWLSLTRNQLLDCCGHYLIYGSEFIYGIAAELNCQYVFKNKGIPTIFHCDVPLENIPSNYIADLNRKIQNGNGNNCGFKIFGAITRDQIINYENPDKIFDPLNRFLTYRFKEIFE